MLGGEKSTVGGQTEDSDIVARFEMLTPEDIFIRFRNISTDELRKKPNSSVFEQSSSLDRPPRIDLFVFHPPTVPLVESSDTRGITWFY